MKETKFGVLALLCYVLAFIAAFAAVVFTVMRVSYVGGLREDTGVYVAAAVTLAVVGFVFHAFHTSTLRLVTLLTEIRDGLAGPREAWLIGQREKR